MNQFKKIKFAGQIIPGFQVNYGSAIKLLEQHAGFISGGSSKSGRATVQGPKEEFIKLAEEIFAECKSSNPPSIKHINDLALAIQRYENTPEIAKSISSSLRSIAYLVRSQWSVSVAANCISKYENNPVLAAEIASLLCRITSNIGHDRVIVDTAEFIMKRVKSQETD